MKKTLLKISEQYCAGDFRHKNAIRVMKNKGLEKKTKKQPKVDSDLQ